MIKLIFENMGNPERMSEIGKAGSQLEITPTTTWEDFKARLEELTEESSDLNLNHFEDYPEDEPLIKKLLNIRQSNMQGTLETGELLERQGQLMEEAEEISGFWERRGELVVIITRLTPSSGAEAKGKEHRERERRAYRPKLKDTPR